MAPIRMVICDKCGKLFQTSESIDVCDECCKKKDEPEEIDSSVLDPIIIDGDEDVEFNEDPDYDMDDEDIDADSFDLDLDDDLFDDDY